MKNIASIPSTPPTTPAVRQDGISSWSKEDAENHGIKIVQIPISIVCVKCVPVSTPEAFTPSLCFVAFSKVALGSPGMPFPFSPGGPRAVEGHQYERRRLSIVPIMDAAEAC